MVMRQRVEALVGELHLEAHVFSGDWLPYSQRQNYLLEADVGASLHLDTVESRFAFRTRILDYIWAGLPMVVTGGDSLSEWVSRHGLGEVVPPNDDQAVADALLRLFNVQDLRTAYGERFDQVRSEFTWERVCEPLLGFCRKPRSTSERSTRTQSGDSDASLSSVPELEAEIARLRSLVAEYEGGRFIKFTRRVHGWREKAGF